MQPEGGNGHAIREELERVLSSTGFSRNERLSRFLRFVVERHLEGKAAQLKESLIAVAVFGRKPDYDPKLDAIVRTEAVRLRARLSKYYSDEGGGDPVIIELPKGGYTPVFRQREADREELGIRCGRLRLAVAFAGLAVASAGMGWWSTRHKSEAIVIAVLPLENLSHDPNNDYFADGLTDEIIRNLSVIEGLAVRSRTSSFAFKGRARSVREMGKLLDANYVLEGSVLRVGQQLRINAELVRVRDDFPLWSGKFDRELTDVFAIQDEISRGIVNQLRLKLGRGRRRYETSMEAYDLYLRARAVTIQRGARGMVEAIKPFEQAIAKDPSFAPAYAGLAAAYAIPLDHLVDDSAKMQGAAQKAIQLDPLLPEAHAALGLVQAHDRQWEQSEASFSRAINFDANRSTTYVHLAVWLLMEVGRVEEALQQLRVAEKNDPLSPEVHRSLCLVLISARRFDEAASYCLKLPEDDPTKRQRLARARLGQGRIDEAIQLLDGPPTRNPGYLGYAYARSGRRDDAEKLALANSNRSDVQALIYGALGDKDRTFEALDRMAAAGELVGTYLTYPELALLRGDPRVKVLRKKVGLPE
jgi:TolB-like protein